MAQRYNKLNKTVVFLYRNKNDSSFVFVYIFFQEIAVFYAHEPVYKIDRNFYPSTFL